MLHAAVAAQLSGYRVSEARGGRTGILPMLPPLFFKAAMTNDKSKRRIRKAPVFIYFYFTFLLFFLFVIKKRKKSNIYLYILLRSKE
jgi:hypothetical protein